MRVNSMFLVLFVVLALAFAASPAFAGNLKFGGDLDRGTSAKEADTKEGKTPGDEDPPIPEEPEDEEPAEPPEFMDEELEGSSFILVIDRSGSMSSSFNGGFPVMDGNGNVVPYPSRWQGVQSEASSCVMAMSDDDTFELISFNSSTYFCFSMMKEANNGNKGAAIGWLYSISAGGGTMYYNPLYAAYNNYGAVDTILFLTDGCPGDGSRALQGLTAWIQRQLQFNAAHSFKAIQIGGSPMTIMLQMAALPNASFTLK